MQNRKLDLSSTGLHILAMGMMLCDHLWVSVVPGNNWLTCIGRLAFPIFAFLIVEGYFHTSNLKKYMLRLLLFAFISEIPFNLLAGSRLFYPVHQNVLWTFLLGLLLIRWNEQTKNAPVWRRILRGAGSVCVGFLAGMLTMVDYYGVGVVTVLVFYFLWGRNWWHFLGQALVLYWLNAEVLGGLAYEVEMFGKTLWIVQQSFAVLALIPVWLYHGRRGYQSKAFRWFCYGFYPAHMLILAMIKMM